MANVLIQLLTQVVPIILREYRKSKEINVTLHNKNMAQVIKLGARK